MPQWTVVITEPINEAGVKLLKDRGVKVLSLPAGADEEALLRVAPQADAFITRGGVKVTREIMEASPRLRAVGVHGIGCDHVDLAAARELGKVVLNTPDALTVTVAEMAVALMLSMTRRIASADKAVRAGGWARKYGDLIGIELMGKTVGLVGMGRIGAATARRLRAFDVKLLYWSRTRHVSIEKKNGIEWAELPSLLARSDIISIHLPGSAETHHIIGANELAAMKRGAMIVNTARGRVIAESALIEALKSGHISAAALDVFEQEPIKPDNPLLSMDNVVLAPHLGASSHEAMQRMATQAAQDVLTVLEGGEPPNRVT
ncbi:MAG: hydroxyacid dehydrogenase [Candidatus Bathyarchaeota archaeon]|nr:hydroxyacid dehydrogenase [Candidatus Bathyarchaeota archaeon]